jgi:lipopolysaccharide export system protein LptA
MALRFTYAYSIAGIVLVGATAGACWWMVEDSATAQHRYHQLLQTANPVNSKLEPVGYTAKQKREGVRKSYYFIPPKGIGRQELRLSAANSELVLNRAETSEILEKMDDFKAMVQESLYYQLPSGKESLAMAEGAIPMQRITYIESESADCNYTHAALKANKAEMTRFTLSGHQLINTLEEGNINPYQSATAEHIDFRYREGILELFGHVSIDHHEGKDLLQLTSDKARLYEDNKIPVVEAEDHVAIIFNNTFTASGDLARFTDGKIAVLGKDRKCLLSAIAGDRIRSNRIDVSLDSGFLEMENPEGVLYPVKGDPATLKFTSESLIWNHKRNQLVLHTNVKIFHPTIGRLENPDEVHIFRADPKGGGTFQKIISEGHSTLTREDPQTQRLYTLVCDGKVVMDHTRGVVFLVAENPSRAPVHLKDDYGEVFADQATVIYTPTEKRVQIPQKIILKGNVKIINRNTAQVGADDVLHMALADKVELTPATNEMIFTSQKGKRVLLYDKGNDIQISAPKLTIRRDQRTKKESFEGSGDVRFSFQDREIALLREKFSLPFNSNKEKENDKLP